MALVRLRARLARALGDLLERRAKGRAAGQEG